MEFEFSAQDPIIRKIVKDSIEKKILFPRRGGGCVKIELGGRLFSAISMSSWDN